MKDNIQTVKDVVVFIVIQPRWKNAKREVLGFKLSNEKIQTNKKWNSKSSDSIYSLHFVDGLPNKVNPLPTMHKGYITKRQNNRRTLIKHSWPAKKVRAEEGEMEIGIINN